MVGSVRVETRGRIHATYHSCHSCRVQRCPSGDHQDLACRTFGGGFAGQGAGGTPRFEAATESRVRDFQKLYRLPETGEVNPATGGVMTLAALVATEGDRSKLREKLKNAVNAVPNSPEYNYWLARSAILAGDYELAARVSPRLTDLSGITVDLGSAIFTTDPGGPRSPRQPEVPFPENFYSYRHDVMAQQAIDTLRTKRYVPSADDQPADAQKKKMLADSAEAWLGAIEAWQQGNADCERQRYDGAVVAYDRCQQAALDYFAAYPGYAFTYADGPLPKRMDELVRRLASNPQAWADIASQITWRRQLLSLAELSEFDGHVIVAGDPVYRGDIIYQLLYGNMMGIDQPPPPTNPLGPEHRKMLMDARLLVIAAVLVPLARAEANRLRRQYAAARQDLTTFLRRSLPLPDTTLTLSVWLACEFIEIPFARLLLVETMLDQAEAQYKARASVDDESDAPSKTADLERLAQLAQDFNNRHIPGDAGNSTRPFQHLVAALTYADTLETMSADGEYVARTRQALDTLHATVTSTVANGDVTSLAFRSIGHAVTIPTVNGIGPTLPGLTSGTHPHEPYLQFNAPDGQTVMRERNPRVYALLLQAQARLLQIWSGFNYLGYRDDYVPPWRFSYLLDRARYFSEHAKNAQRDYLNFLNNAENQEFKELSASQNVELEKANVQIETARVDQATKEVTASKESQNLADTNASDAQQRVDNYKDFSSYADLLFDTKDYQGRDPVEGVSRFLQGETLGLPGYQANFLDVALNSVGDFYSQGLVSKRKEALVAHAQRELELKNLKLAVDESKQAAVVAADQWEVAKAGLVVAGLQRQTALLRQEFALQNLQFMRSQTLNTEQWYRMAGAIRSVSDTYLRYAIETAFLAQQAYNFEADKRLNLIRFDYDLSDVGAMLAADFLLRDLDTFEQDLIVSQQTRLQQVRYVLSMAREFPDTLRVLADQGEVMFSMRLEQLERRFPGLVNVRISTVDLQPVALMDPTRVSVQLTHLGTGMVRLKAQPGSSALNSTDLATDGDWLLNIASDWPVKIHASGPDTEIFSGLSRQEASSASTITANERGAFEGLPGASSWRIDMSMRENRIVPNSLADVLMIFTLSGYYDATLRQVVDHTPRKPLASTTWFSGHQQFPDAFYQFNRVGRMDWQITPDFLALQGSLGELQNVAVLCSPSQKRPELGRLTCSYPVEFEVDAAGNIRLLRELPRISLATNGLELSATIPSGSSVTFDFGDGTGLADSTALPHTYARPGRYEVLVRIAANGRLTEYRAAVVVSRQHPVLPPCIAVPKLDTTVSAGKITLQPSLLVPSGESLSVTWRIDNHKPDPSSNPVTFTLGPGRYVLRFSAIRPLIARFYSQQRYAPTAPLPLKGFHLATNRTFDVTTGTETTANLNAFGQHVFGPGILAPTDRWTLELPLDDNPCAVSVSSTDVKQHDLGELADAFLALEYKVKDE
jgi:hypothetical protein